VDGSVGTTKQQEVGKRLEPEVEAVAYKRSTVFKYLNIRAVVNTVMNIRLHKSEQPLAVQEALHSMECSKITYGI
jgi:hypothetical protein